MQPWIARVLAVGLIGIGAAGCEDGGATGPDENGDPDPEAFVQVAAGLSHSCGLRAGGDLFCWGRNDSGQLGDGNPGSDAVTEPVAVQSDLEFTAVVAGTDHTCALTTAGMAHCWGNDSDGQLGHGPNSLVNGLPTPVTGGRTFTSLTAGNAHSCGLDDAGAVFCWGANGFGQLGDGNGGSSSSAPVPVDTDLEFTAIGAGGDHTCGIAGSGAAYCWGNNGTSQLGDGTGIPRDSPVQVQGGLTFESIIAGGVHTCARTDSGDAYCWGFNFFGQLGDGTEFERVAPTPVAGDLEFDHLSAGSDHTCGITPSGDGYCWGFNGGGRLGNDTDTARSDPGRVEGQLTFTGLAAGTLHTCGVTSDGAAYCWGTNDSGQLGDGSQEERRAPVRVVEP